MAKFRKKPIVIEATQWFKNGDHPDVEVPELLHEQARRKCAACSETMDTHGWIDTLEGKHVVCPSDWIITGIQGERYPCKQDIFEKTYEQENKQ
jgi:hypothetical protein